MDNQLRELERAAAGGDEEAVLRFLRKQEQVDGFEPTSIVIDDETWEDVELGYDITDDVKEIHMGSREYVVAVDAEAAGAAARARWAEMAADDPSEFRAIVGDEALVKWALGQSAGPGTSQVSSLEDWLDLHLNAPEEEWARYDGHEVDVSRVGSEVVELLGFVPTVAYRSN